MESKLAFRLWLELQQDSPSYLDSLGRELNIDPKALTDNPQWLGNASLGKYTYNGMTYRIIDWEKDGSGKITGATVEPIDAQRAYSKDDDGHMVRNPEDNPDKGKKFFISKEKLDKMMNQEVGATPPPADGGMGGGMPPMPGGPGQ